MDTILLVLCLSPKALKASEIARVSGHDDSAARNVLLRLLAYGLVARQQVSGQGPTGTYQWTATREGYSATARLITWLKTGSTLAASAVRR